MDTERQGSAIVHWSDNKYIVYDNGVCSPNQRRAIETEYLAISVYHRFPATDMIDNNFVEDGTDLAVRLLGALECGWWNATVRNKLCKRCGIEPNGANREKIKRARNRVEERFDGIVVGSFYEGYFIVVTPEGAQIAREFRQNHIAGCHDGLGEFIRKVETIHADQSNLDEFLSEC